MSMCFCFSTKANPKTKEMETLDLSSASRVKGAIIVGPRESGKHEVIDACVNDWDPNITHRAQFSAYMRGLVPQLLEIRGHPGNPLRDPLPKYVHQVVHEENLRVLILEEFELTNVMDAMLMRRLFLGLMGYGVGVVLTSSRPPSAWYSHGISSSKLAPFRLWMQQECQLVRLDVEASAGLL